MTFLFLQVHWTFKYIYISYTDFDIFAFNFEPLKFAYSSCVVWFHLIMTREEKNPYKIHKGQYVDFFEDSFIYQPFKAINLEKSVY